MKRDLACLPAQTPESLRSARPTGPVRFSLHDAPEYERPGLHRGFIGRAVMGVDVESAQRGGSPAAAATTRSGRARCAI
jgi:hypothetical protein